MKPEHPIDHEKAPVRTCWADDFAADPPGDLTDDEVEWLEAPLVEDAD